MPAKGSRGSEPDPPDRKPFLLRLPPELTEDLREWANQDLRSLNAQIEFLLREAVRKRKGKG
jgi:hypothetical protein